MLWWLLGAMVVALAVSFGNLSLSYGLAAARRALREGDAKLAVSVLKRHADRGARSPEWQYLMARAQRRDGRLADAEQQLARAKAAGWSADDIRREQLLIQARRGYVKQVEPQLVELLESGVSDEDAEDIYEAMSQGYWTSYYVNDALRCLEFWSDWQTENLVPRLRIAELYERTARPDPAIAEYRQILERDPDRPEVRAKLGALLLKKLEVNEAADTFERCLAGSPETAEAVLGLAECRRRQGSDDEVTDVLYDALTLDLTPSQAARANGVLGTLALEDHDYGRAVRLLEESVMLDADDSETHASLAAALAALGQEELAAAERQRARETSDLLSRLNRTTRKVLDDPTNADLRCEAGLILIERGHWSDAADWIKTAVEIDPRHRAAHEGLAKYYEHVGDLELAKQHRRAAEQALQSDPAASHTDG